MAPCLRSEVSPWRSSDYSNRVPSFCDGRWVLKTLIVVRTMLVAGCTVLTTFYVLTTAVVPGTALVV